MTRTLTITLFFVATNYIAQTFNLTDKQFLKGQTHTFWKVYFELGQATLLVQDDSKLTLDSIQKFLTGNPNTKIEIGVHTDTRGKAPANLVLSQKRADEIKKYLVGQNVDANRLTAKGYGSTKLYFTKSQQEEHARRNKCEPGPGAFIGNRRVTITILNN